MSSVENMRFLTIVRKPKCGGTILSYREDARTIKALADENRLAIMCILQHGERCACVLLEELNVTQPTLSHHMKILCDSGLVNARKDGKWMYYSISEESVKSFVNMINSYTNCVDKPESTPKHPCECKLGC